MDSDTGRRAPEEGSSALRWRVYRRRRRWRIWRADDGQQSDDGPHGTGWRRRSKRHERQRYERRRFGRTRNENGLGLLEAKEVITLVKRKQNSIKLVTALGSTAFGIALSGCRGWGDAPAA